MIFQWTSAVAFSGTACNHEIDDILVTHLARNTQTLIEIIRFVLNHKFNDVHVAPVARIPETIS